MNRYFILFLLSIFTVVPVFSSGTDESQEGGSPHRVAVSILPQKYFVERIAGNSVKVTVLVLPGESPATYEPTPKQVGELAGAEVLFTIGVPFERTFIPRIKNTLKNLIIVDTSEGIKKRNIDGSNGTDEGAEDPHIWMSPVLVKKQAYIMAQTLSRIIPDRKEIFFKNYRSFAEDLDNLDTRLADILKPYRGSTLFVYHPSFGYFADRYGLKQKAIETGGKAPGPKTLNRIIEEVKEENVKVIFVQPEFQHQSAETIAKATGTAIVTIDPLAENYLENMEHMADVLKQSLQ